MASRDHFLVRRSITCGLGTLLEWSVLSMLHPRAYKDKQVVVLGLAKSGVAVAKLLYEAGAKVIVNDKKERSLCPEAEVLEERGIAVVCGGHPADLIHSEVELVVKNPGIPYSAEPVQKAIELGIEIVSEV